MKKVLSILLSILMAFSAFSAMPFSAFADTYKGIELDENKFYFDTSTTGWTLGTTDKIAFYITSDKYGEEMPYGGKKLCGTLCESGSEKGVWEYDPAAKGIEIEDGVQYKIQFYNTGDPELTYPLYFDSNCLGHVAVCDGTEYENSTDFSKTMLVAFWNDLDSSVYGPMLAITSSANVVGTCVKDNETKLDMFENFISVAGDTGATGLENARVYVVELGTKTEQQLIDDLGTDLGLTKQDVYDAFNENSVETTWDYTISTLPGDVEIALKCGDSVYYYYTDNGATLNLIGTGDTWDYDYFSDKSPFSDNADIKSITVEDGITGIGDNIFMECINLESVSLPASIKTIGDSAFADCGYYGPVLPEGLVTIGENAFVVCAQNTDPSIYSVIFIPSTVTSIGNEAFSDFNNVSIVVVPENASYSNDTFSSVSSEGFDIWKYSVCAEQTGAPEGTKFIDIKSREGTRQETTLPCGFTYNSKYIIKSLAVDGVTLSHNYNSNNECTVCGKVKEVTSVRNYADLKELARQVNAGNDYAGKTVVLENDIVCKNNENDTDYATDWVPIGNESTPFKGTFDGKGYTITGLSTAENITASYVGLFGYVNGGTIQNVGLEGGAICGKEYVGGIVGYLTSGTVTYCYNTGKLTASGDTVYVGGIAGKIDNNSLVTICYNTGDIITDSATFSVGGIAGQNANSSIISCYNTGSFTSSCQNYQQSSYFGGIAGMATCDIADAFIKDCYNTGSIYFWYHDDFSQGGVLGFSNNVDNSHLIYVQNCYYDVWFCNAGYTFWKYNGWYNETDSCFLNTGRMTGINALNNMKFSDSSVWFTKSETKDADGNYCLCYPHLKGFNKKADGSQETDSTKIPIGEWPGYKPVYIVFDSDSFEYDGNAKTFNVIIGDSYVPESATNVEYCVSNEGDAGAWTFWGDTIDFTSNTCWVEYETDSAIVDKTFKGLNETTEEDVFDYYCRYYDLNRKNDDGSFVEVDSLTNAGKYRIETIIDNDELNENSGYYGSPRNVFEKEIVITPKPAKIKVSSADFTYNGTAQSSPSVTVEGLLGNDALKANISSSITFPGESPVENKVDSIEFTTGLKGNYDITTENGQLTMKKASNAITITAASREWTYDGNAHSNNSVTITSGELFAGDSLVATATGSVTNVSDTVTGNNKIADGYKIMHGTTDVTENYVITPVNGTLTIKPKAVTITAKSEEFTYDGTAHSCSLYDVEGLVGSDAISAIVEGSITFPGESPVSNAVKSYQFTTGNPNNYTVTKKNGTLTMSKASAPITITSASQEWMYDGSAHSNSTVTLTGGSLFEGDTLTATATGSVTNFADTVTGNNSIAPGYKIMHGTTDVTDNYVITPVNGTLTIKPAAITITADDKESNHGLDLLALTYKIGGNYVDGDELGITLNADIDNTKPGAYTITPSWNNNANYTAMLVDGTYTVGDNPHYYGTQGDERFTCTVCGAVDDDLKAQAEAADKDAADTAAANAVTEMINALPEKEEITTADEAAIKKAREAYDSLTDDQKAKVTQETVKKLTDAEKALAEAKAEEATAAQEKAKAEFIAGVDGTSTDGAVIVKWGKVPNAKRYVIYAAYCDKNHKYKYKKIKTVSGKVTKYKIKKLGGKKLDPKKNVKVYIVAQKKKNGKWKKIFKTPTFHIAGAKSKFSNVKKIKVKKAKYSLAVGKTAKIKAKLVLADKSKKAVNHVRKLRFKSTNTAVVKVTKSGKIKAVGKGKATVFVYSNNGTAKAIIVTVN